MSADVSIRTLQELIREELQLGWSHLEDGNEDFALHHLGSAVRKIAEIKQLKGDDAEPRVAPKTQSLSYLNDQGNHS